MIRTKRLLLRPLEPGDAPAVQALAGAREIALNTLRIPHPYPDGAALEWIQRESGEEVRFAITLADGDALIGAIGLVIARDHDVAELGYWIGVPYWGRGYATEAAAAVIRFGFTECALNRIEAAHFTRNPASGRVLENIGMRREGTLRQKHKKEGEYLDEEMYAILRDEWLRHSSRTP